MQELIQRKDRLIAERATPPMYLQMDLLETELSADVFGTRFDVILIDPPWEEYARRAPGVGDSLATWTWKQIENLKIEVRCQRFEMEGTLRLSICELYCTGRGVPVLTDLETFEGGSYIEDEKCVRYAWLVWGSVAEGEGLSWVRLLRRSNRVRSCLELFVNVVLR